MTLTAGKAELAGFSRGANAINTTPTLGEVIIDRNDIFGEGVNIAARLENLADPGGVCISASVYEQVKNKVDFVFDDLGDHAVKNIAESVRAYRGRITPDDLPTRRIEPTTRAAWRGAGLALGAVLALEAIGIALWYGFWRTPPPQPEFLQSATQTELKLALQPLPKHLSPGTVFRECGNCPEMMVAILLPGNLTTASPLYLHVLGEEKHGAIDKVDRTLEIRDMEVLFIKLDLLTYHHSGWSPSEPASKRSRNVSVLIP